MINWLNESPSMGNMRPPVMRVTNGRKHTDHAGADTAGFWCRKTQPVPEVQANPRNRVPYDLQDPHFTIAVVSVPGLTNTGIVFQAGHPHWMHTSEITFSNSQPQARCTDRFGLEVVLTSPTRLATNTPAVVTFSCAPGAQRLRVNSSLVGSGSATFGASPCDQLLIGWGYRQYYPQMGFGGSIYAVVTGRGSPTSAELSVLERYLGTTAGIG
jgi:endoglucanase